MVKALAPLLAACSLLLAACGGAGASAPAATDRSAQAETAANAFPALTGRVVDRAELLSPAEEARLTAALAAIERRTTDQVVVATLPSLEGRDINAYGTALGRHWGIGQRGKDNGVLITVAWAERRVRIDVGYGLERIIPDERAGAIIRQHMVPQFRAGRPAAALDAGVREIAATLIAHADEPRVGRSRP